MALWVAPNGGLSEFWPLATLVTIGLVWIVVANLRGRPIDLKRALPGLMVIVSLVIVTGTLASWWAPFGWISWGPRLSLPTLPAAAPHRDSRIRRGARTTAPSAAGDAGTDRRHHRRGDRHRAGAGQRAQRAGCRDDLCSRPIERAQSSRSVLDTAHYYHCIDHWAWARHWTLLDTFKGLGHLWDAVFAAAFVAVWIALILAVARGAQDPGLGDRGVSGPRRMPAGGGELNPTSL